MRPIWGDETAALQRARTSLPVDVIITLALVALTLWLLRLGEEWAGPARAAVEIDLSPWALPRYTLLSLSRGLIAYVISLGFSLAYGYWAAKSERAGRLLIPILDVLQSIPVLGFMPGLVLALVSLFPRENVGLELAAVLMIFTGQAWNMTFSFYHSLRSIPAEQRDIAKAYGFAWWQRLIWIELPFSTIGLIWNSMMSVAGGWFFLMISEAFVLGDKDFRLPGLGSYMSVAVARGNVPAMASAIGAMVVMIVCTDQILFRPMVVWAQKFRVEEGGHGAGSRSVVLDALRRSRVLHLASRLGSSVTRRRWARRPRPALPGHRRWGRGVSSFVLVALGAVLLVGARTLLMLLASVSAADWLVLGRDGLLTLGRVLLSCVIGTAWALPAGLAIGLSPRLSRALTPVAQVVASFPAPMLFPLVVAMLRGFGVSLGWGSILIMLLGTQWYILFNVIAGASAVPSDLSEAARSYGIRGLLRFRVLYLPAVLPYLVTGWVTAAGGAWNASIVAEFVTENGETFTTAGLGAQISRAAATANFPRLAASVTLMSTLVVVFNRVVWRRLGTLAETRFSLSQ